MSREPLVSVVMIFLDAERFLAEAIESVRAQSYAHWELLLVDDGSSDGSGALARRHAAGSPQRIRYLEHPGHENRGKSSSRNLGIREAKGEYVTFLDADDVFLPHKLERQVAILRAHPEAMMCYGGTEYWWSWTGRRADLRRDAVPRPGVRPDASYRPPELMIRFLRRGGSVPCICAVLARRDVVVEVGGFEESIQNLYEDQVLLAKLCLEGPVFVESGCGERYRQHPDSTSAAAIRSGEYHPRRPNPARDAYLLWLAGYAARRGIDDPAFRRALRGALRWHRHPFAARLGAPFLHLLEGLRRLVPGRSSP